MANDEMFIEGNGSNKIEENSMSTLDADYEGDLWFLMDTGWV